MKHLKRFNKINEEFFGGPPSHSYVPKIDKIIEKLNTLRGKIIEYEMVDKDTRKIEVIYNYLVQDMDLDMLSSTKRKSDELTGNTSKEGIVDKVKRTKRNW